MGSPLVYRRFDNFHCRTFAGLTYLASCFIPLDGRPLRELLPSEGRVVQEGGVQFQSEFQSGNLLMALSRGPLEYDLILQNDVNTRGYSQWFYFSVKKVPPGTTLRFNLVNMAKRDSLFAYGMLPAVFSSRRRDRGWSRAGHSVSYYRNGFKKQHLPSNYSTLSFSYDFKNEDDTVYFAHSYPYTCSTLSSFLGQYFQNPIRSKFTRRSILCRSPGGLPVECLTIAEGEGWERRRAIVVVARQHPGETPSSFTVEGLINFLSSKSKQAQFIRRHYQVKVVPMLNVDGVTAGNFRCSLAGCDLNRRWLSPSRSLHPELLALRRIICDLGKEKRLRYFLDLHGHSRKLSAFFFSNKGPALQTRLLPYLCAKINPDISFKQCTYSNPPEKKATARIAFADLFGQFNTSTFETSFYGTSRDKVVRHFTEDDIRRLGESVGGGLFYFLLQDHEQKKGPEYAFISKAKRQIRAQESDIQTSEMQDSGSDSQPEADCFDAEVMTEHLQAKRRMRDQQQEIIKLEKQLTQARQPLQFTSRGSSNERQFTVRAISVSRGKNLRLMELGKVQSVNPRQRELALEPLSYKSVVRPKIDMQQLKKSLIQRQSRKDKTADDPLLTPLLNLPAAQLRTLESKGTLFNL